MNFGSLVKKRLHAEQYHSNHNPLKSTYSTSERSVSSRSCFVCTNQDQFFRSGKDQIKSDGLSTTDEHIRSVSEISFRHCWVIDSPTADLLSRHLALRFMEDSDHISSQSVTIRL